MYVINYFRWITCPSLPRRSSVLATQPTLLLHSFWQAWGVFRFIIILNDLWLWVLWIRDKVQQSWRWKINILINRKSGRFCMRPGLPCSTWSGHQRWLGFIGNETSLSLFKLLQNIWMFVRLDNRLICWPSLFISLMTRNIYIFYYST